MTAGNQALTQPEIMDMTTAADYLGVSGSHLSYILAGKIPGAPAIPHVRANRRARPGALVPGASAATPSTFPGTPAALLANCSTSRGSLTLFGKLSRARHGRVAFLGRGICNLRFKLRENEPGPFSGYSNLGCFNVAPLMSKQANANPANSLLNRMDAGSAIFTGMVENGAIHFNVDKTIGTDINGCVATSFTATLFGTNQIAAEWQEDTCQGGYIIMQKARS